MLKVLVNAYACSPDMGSEPGMGWNWCMNLAKYCELFIITEGEFRDRIEAVVPTLPQGANMHFYYNPVPERVRQMCWNQGDWRFYWHYRKWQKRTLDIARQICAEHKIDILHQLNMIGYREPGLLWKIKGPKFVWGPVGGADTMPLAYLKGAGMKMILFNVIKNIINSLQYKYQPNVRRAVKSADVLIAATNGCQRKFQDYYYKVVYLINETGCDVIDSVSDSRIKTNESKAMKILWVGKFDFRKQLGLALRTIAELRDIDIVLHIAGSGDEVYYKQLAKKLEIEEKIVWHGQLQHEAVLELMKQSDLFFFTSIMDATSTVVMEAIQNHLPVVCFDTCGFGTVVDESIGIKAQISNPEQSVNDFSEIIKSVYNDRKRLSVLSANCVERIKKFEWNHKAQMMVDLYRKLYAKT